LTARPTYLLGTDTCSYVMKRSSAQLSRRICAVPLDDQAVSIVTVAELLHGVQRSSRSDRAREAFDAFIRHLAVLDWGYPAAEHYAQIRADLRRRGCPIGSNDLMIAAHARSAGATLVTNNVREFERVEGLRVVNWAR